MGLLSKIEDKLAGGSHNSESSKGAKEEQQAMKSSEQGGSGGGMGDISVGGMRNVSGGGMRDVSGDTSEQMSSGSRLQHPIGTGQSGSGITGGLYKDGMPVNAGSTGISNNQGLSSNQGLSGMSRQQGVSGYEQEGSNMPSTTSTLRHDTRDVSGVSGTSTSDRTPRQPFDPYSSKGQQIAANAADTRAGYRASQNRAEAGNTGSRNTVPESSVPRTQHGGISNGMENLNLHSGPHQELENRSAVPTAGGERLGSGSMPGSYDSPSQSQGQQHSYGRDAALAGGAGAGAYGTSQLSSDSTGPASKTIGPHSSNVANVLDPRVQPDPSVQGSGKYSQGTDPTSSSQDTYGTGSREPSSEHHYSRDAALAGGAGAGAGAYAHHEHNKLQKKHGQPSTFSSEQQQQQPGRAFDTSHTAPRPADYGQDISYMNRPPAEEPLSSSHDFTSRHPTATGTGIGGGAATAATGAAYASHSHDKDSHTINPAGGLSAKTGISGLPGQTSSTSSTSTPVRSSMAKQMASAYEAGYEAGYRDAMEQK